MRGYNALGGGGGGGNEAARRQIEAILRRHDPAKLATLDASLAKCAL